MIKRLFLMAVPVLLSVSGAYADTYNFKFTGSGFAASGVLTATTLGGGTFLATSGTGTLVGGSISPDSLTLIPGGPGVFYSPSGQFLVDNVLYPTATPGNQLDNWGLLFHGSSYEVNIWGNGPDTQYSLYTNEGGSYQVGSGEFTLSSGISAANGNAVAPEPGFYGVMLVGLSGLVFAGWRRRRA